MSKLSLKLENALADKINYPCKVWFDNTYKGGWMFTTDQTHQQRLGYNFKQASKFINDFDWAWLKKELKDL